MAATQCEDVSSPLGNIEDIALSDMLFELVKLFIWGIHTLPFYKNCTQGGFTKAKELKYNKNHNKSSNKKSQQAKDNDRAETVFSELTIWDGVSSNLANKESFG